jgi:uncharacterized protein involved in outer membrane biogenesis
VNSFLLALTAVLIVVLSALFAAPLFIDWNDYRPVFETQASRFLGRDVKVGGKVHLVLLPAPELRFDKVQVADAKGSFAQPLLEARSIEAWLNITALLRGVIEARRITISEPVLRVALKDDGTGSWSDVGRAGEALPFAPKEVLLDEVSVSGGRIELARPGTQPLVLDDVFGTGSATSLSGPYKVSANYIFAGRPQELRFSTSASDQSGVFRLKSALRDPDRDTTYLLEGDVSGFKQKPSFDGAVIMRIASLLPAEEPPAEEPKPESEALPGETGSAPGAQPSAFELKGKLKATPERADLPDFEIAAHANGRSQMMKGKLALEFGEHPKAEAELAASWIDVDALLAANPPGTVPAESSAANVLSSVAGRALQEAAKIGEGRLTVALDQASIGGDLVGNIDMVVAAKGGAVTIERLDAHLPGASHIGASGRLSHGESGPVFEGPITLDGSKLKTLVRWAAGAHDMSAQATAGAFAFTAKTVVGGGNLTLEDASGELSGTKFSGALQYQGGEHRVLSLNLDSERLDLREVMGESAAWQSWLPDAAPTSGTAPGSDQSLLGALRDDEVHATLHVGEILLPNIPPGKLDAKFSLVKDTLDVERLDFAAPGAVALDGNGRIERLSHAPSGQADLSARAMTAGGLKTMAELFGLGDGFTKSKQLPALAPLDLHIGLTASHEGAASSTAFEVKGVAGKSVVAIVAKATGDVQNLADAAIEIDGSAEGDRPQTLLGLLIPGLAADRLAVAGADRGKLTVKAQGVPSRGVTGRAELVTDTMQLAFEGDGSLKSEGISLAGVTSAKGGNAGMVLALFGLGASPSAQVPLELRADVVKSAAIVDLKSISGAIDGIAVAGDAHFDLGRAQPRFTLTAKADSASLPALLGTLVAWQRTPSTETLLGTLNQAASDVWPARGFALEALGNADGDIRIEANSLSLGAPFQVADATLTATVNKQGLSITALEGELFGGSFAANGTLVPKGTGAELKAHAELASGKMDQLSQALAGRALAKGPFTFVMDVSGEGLSPPGLVAGLSGDGALFLDAGAVQALSLEPLKRIAKETNRSKKLKLDKDQIAARMTALQETLTKGSYPYSATALPFVVRNGTLKLDPTTLGGKGAETKINGYIELASLRVDSEWGMRLKDSRDADMPPVNLVLAGSLRDAGSITPQIDTAPLEGFLTVRRMEGDVERLETLDVSGRGQPDAEAEAESTAEADAAEDGEPIAEATTEDLAAMKAAVEKRAVDRAAEAKRLAAAKAAAEKAAAEQAAAEKRAAEQAAAEKAAAERAAAAKAAAEKRAAEKAAAEKAAMEKRAAEQAAAERRAAEKKRAAEQAAAEKAAAEKALAEKRAAEKAAAEQAAAEQAAAQKAEAERAAAEKAAAEKAAAEKVEAEKAAARAAAERAAAEKAEAERVAAERAVAEKAEAERALAEKRAEQAAAEQAAAAEHPAGEKATAERSAEAPRPVDLEANTGLPGSGPAGQGEALPWNRDQAAPTQGAAPSEAPTAEPEPAAAAAQEDITEPVAPSPRRRTRPKPAPDDWKKGISIFGGG